MPKKSIHLNTIPEALQAMKQGEMIVVIDRPDRENQGDIIMAAEAMTPEKAAFIIKECGGIFCIPMSQQRALELNFPLMVAPVENTEKLKCKFTVSVDAKNVVDHGISASDRAKTVAAIISSRAKPEDFLKPGHAYPLIAEDEGVLSRDGHTEATIDLLKLAGMKPIGVLSEILDATGAPAIGETLFAFAKKHNLLVVSIEDLVAYRKTHTITSQPSASVQLEAEANLPTHYGTFAIKVFRSIQDNREHVALIKGDPTQAGILTRIHSQCLTGDTFFSKKCDCNEQLHMSFVKIQAADSGILLYTNQEGRGIGLTNKIKAYALQEQGLDTVEANEALDLPVDARDYAVTAEILHMLGTKSVSLLTNNLQKLEKLEKSGIKVEKQIALLAKPNEHNAFYLETKRKKLGHRLT